MDAGEQYALLGNLLQDQPDWEPASVLQWMGRVYAAVKFISNVDAARIEVIMATAHVAENYSLVTQTNSILYKLIAVAEMKAPAPVRGAFIAAASPLDALNAVSKVLSTAATTVRIVDPYMDDKVLTDFAVLAREGVKIELLTDVHTVKPSFVPAVVRFSAQFGAKRPVEARESLPRQLHDRLFILDQKEVFVLSQSLNGLAVRSHASVIRADPETASLKVAAYEAIWQGATLVP
ncbi:phosphatidylserine/phosphatidylglycerophosphate/cardiolipin synthase family protein [Rhizobium sp. TH2]|uniref:phospholipase D family protein n=1 Tax=Rhizobium sp. TH2 TaxID=2775403 RepID=UPI0021582FCF|nr:phospholipase D family protein [Rhizobium sp. TH2]UVC10175.1 phosphatidylserine/phosphatidylglycerophosphate/cardiolipin synthase family protein [Rhizobium sp. TH2]